MFGGDALRQSVHVASGARAVLTSQAALQVHPSQVDASAVVEHCYTVDAGGELHCHWDPIIPFAGANLAQRFDLRIAPDARLYWADAVMTGRVSRGETWQFRELAHELRVHIGDALRYLERYRLVPGDRGAERTWIAGDAAYLATTLVYGGAASSESAETLHRELGSIPGVRVAVDCVDVNLLVARLAASNGIPFADARAACRHLALDRVFESPQLRGRKSV